jgi:diguanylate cyclase (GGDEF)-like protein
VAVLPHSDAPAALAWAERVRARIAGSAVDVGEGELVGVTASFGVAGARSDGESRAAIIDAADEALYQAKDRGRDRVAMAPARGAVKTGARVGAAR